MTETPAVGDLVFIHLHDGLNARLFGSGVRFGVVTDVALDALEGETVMTLDDGGPRIYLSHVRAISNHGPDVVAVG